MKVLEADPERKRISLTLRLDDEVPPPGGPRPRNQNAEPGRASAGKPPAARPQPAKPAPADTAMAEALRRAGLGK